MEFRTTFGRDIFQQKYAHEGCETWGALSKTLAQDVCGRWMHKDEVREIARIIEEMQFIPAGRYLYYAGRPVKYFNNCFAMIAEDTREGWSELAGNATNALMCGGGVGVYYGRLRGRGSRLSRTGGVASGPVPLMHMMNEIGRNVQQGGSRRSALWAGLNWNHPDIEEFLTIKNWSEEAQLAKARDYNHPAPLDMTNISVCFDDEFFKNPDMDLWNRVVSQMCRNGEPGMAFNLGEHSEEVGRNACCEFISDSDSDVCNLGSINYSHIKDLRELAWVTYHAGRFLMCGSLRADLPYEKCRKVRTLLRKIGTGVMGLHEWLLQRGYPYGMNPELEQWEGVRQRESRRGAEELAYNIGVSAPIRFQAIAPSGTISILAGTSSGIEPIFATAMRRRYLVGTSDWKAQYIIDPTAEAIARDLGIDPDTIETAYSLAEAPERRVKFQADMQRFTDMGISSTVNLPDWGSQWNNPDTVKDFAATLLKYAPSLRGITAYPNNGRAGQTITAVPYREAKDNTGIVYDDNVAVGYQCKSGVCSM